MNIQTHKDISKALCGKPIRVEENEAEVLLETTRDMAVDDKGLVHGGFVFGLADHAAMLAVNKETVVLGGSLCRFLRPAKVGDTLHAYAHVRQEKGKKRTVEASVFRDKTRVFSGDFTCFVLEKHILE